MACYSIFSNFFLLCLWFFAIAESDNERAYQSAHDHHSSSIRRHMRDDFVKANGIYLRRECGQGEVVTLRGTNLGGWMVQEGWMSPIGVQDEWTLRATLAESFGNATMEELIEFYQRTWLQSSDLDIVAELGLNTVRVPMLYMNFVNSNGSLKRNAFDRLDWVVDECAKRGIYVILDLHGTFGSQNGNDHSGQVLSVPQLWTEEANKEKTVQLWKQIATRYRGNPTVAGYDILNEPASTKVNVTDLYDRIYAAIRSVDHDHAIIMEAPWQWEQLDPPANRSWENVVYSLHYYNWDTTNGSSQNGSVDWAVRGILQYQQAWQVPFYAGEFQFFAFNAVWERFLSSLNALGISWTPWTFKVRQDFGKWGLFTNNTNPIPSIANDSVTQIRDKWSKYATDYFQPNVEFQELLRRMSANFTADNIETRRAEFIAAYEAGQ